MAMVMAIDGLNVQVMVGMDMVVEMFLVIQEIENILAVQIQLHLENVLLVMKDIILTLAMVIVQEENGMTVLMKVTNGYMVVMIYGLTVKQEKTLVDQDAIH